MDNNKAQKETFLQKSQEFCNFFKKYLNENMSELEKHIFKEKSKDYRNILKSLGEKCGVEIEPDTITLILDYISNISKIIYSICPGAGGYDAACCLVENDFNSNIIKEKINELKQLDFFNSIEIKKILENNNIIKNIQPIFEQLKNFEIEVFEIPICQTGLLRHEVFDQEFTSKLYEYSKLKIEL